MNTVHNAEVLSNSGLKWKGDKFKSPLIISSGFKRQVRYTLVANSRTTCKLRKGEHNIYNYFRFLNKFHDNV